MGREYMWGRSSLKVETCLNESRHMGTGDCDDLQDIPVPSWECEVR